MNSGSRGRPGKRLFYNFDNQLFRIQLSQRGGWRIFNFKTANSRRVPLATTSTQYVKRDVTSPRPQLHAARINQAEFTPDL